MAERTDIAGQQDPLEALAGLVRDSDRPVPMPEVSQWADELGIEYSSENELGRRVSRTVGAVRFSRVDATLTWDDEQPLRTEKAEPGVAELFEHWLDELGDADRIRLREQIDQRLAGSDTSSSDRALATALGAGDGSVDWLNVPVGDDMSARMIERLTKTAEASWLVEAATTLPGRRADVAKRRLQELAVHERNEAAVDALNRWLSEDRERSTSKQLRRVAAAIGGDITPLLTKQVLESAIELAQDEPSDDPEVQRNLAALAHLFVTSSSSTTDSSESDDAVNALNAAISKHNESGLEALRRWILAASATSKSSADRQALLSTIARSESSAAVFDAQVFRGLDLTALGETLSRAEFSPLLGTGLRGHVRPAVSEATPAKVGEALAAVARYPILEDLVPLDRLSRLFERDEASARVGRRIAERLIELAVAEQRERFELAGHEQDRKLGAVEAQLDQTRRDLHQQADQRAALETRLREAIKGSTSARDTELRQAQLDALRALAENIETTRSVLATFESSALVEQHLADSVRRIEQFGVSVDGHPGDRVAYDPALHDPVDVDTGVDVEVLSPTYRLADSVTPLRYGRVRRVSTGN